ncbi:MAG: RluA family pseudouridine synthase, partial [Myxococcales bacterium]|nr:RluA family pseudouridine synthase [Myxococcales bacterium]
LLVLDKPAGLAVHPTAARFEATVTRWLARHHPEAEPVHRLDVETSGVLVCARHALAHRTLKAAFADRGVHKRYRAVVEGLPEADRWVVDTPLGFDAGSAVRLKMGPGDLPARTAFEVVRRGRRRALIAAEPLTGRQHQIRVHAQLSGHPLVGDKLYGPDERIFLAHLDGAVTPAMWAALGHPRHALHAASVRFEWRGQTRAFEAPWPAELDALVI